MTPVYLDYNATAPLHPEARAAMVAMFDVTGNPSSVHHYGRAARAQMERARRSVADLVRARPQDVIFTSGASEANAQILNHLRGGRIWISAIEHPSVLENAALENEVHKNMRGPEHLPVTGEGVIDADALARKIAAEGAPDLLSVMAVNNETGVIQPIAELGDLARKHDIWLHVDAVQAAGRMETDLGAWQADSLSLSAHKLGGPQGIGALVIRKGRDPAPLIRGGGQERKRRAGTENLAGMAGFGAACDAAANAFDSYQKLSPWRDRFEAEALESMPQACIFGRSAPRAANTSLIALPGIPAATQLMDLDLRGFAVSSGAACSSGTVKPSHVLEAMGADAAEAGSALRVSMGWASTEDEIRAFTQSWIAMAQNLLARRAA